MRVLPWSAFALLLPSCYPAANADELGLGFIPSPQAYTHYTQSRANIDLIPFTVEKDYAKGVVPFSQSPTAVLFAEYRQVPVFDQGQYGTCVTFASTAAMDMVLGNGVDISQQCTLELNMTLGENFWNGAYNAGQIINPLKQYGAVASDACPDAYGNQWASITLEDYAALVDSTIQVERVQIKYHSPIAVADVKAAIKAHHVVAIGFLLLNNGDRISVNGFNVKMPSGVKQGGLWACKQASSKRNYCGQSNAGHEVVIVGYDDAQRLFKIRNSWGVAAGDDGDFYMTYEFFQQQVIDGTEVWAE